MNNVDIIIVGGGPAGCAAGMFTAQSNYKTLLLHRGNSPAINDFRWILPGLPQQQNASQWINNLQQEAKRSGLEWVGEAVAEAILGESTKEIKTTTGRSLQASVIILSAGCHDRQGLIEGEGPFSGRGVSYNAIQDGFQFKGVPVAIEGKNEEAAKEALYLSRFVEKVYCIIPAARLEADNKILEAIKKNEKIECLYSSSIKKIEGENSVTQVVALVAGNEKNIPVRGVFLYARIGKPIFDYLKGAINISESGSVRVDENFMTSIPGVFACGDIIAGQPQLAFVAAAQGLATGYHAVRYLQTV